MHYSTLPLCEIVEFPRQHKFEVRPQTTNCVRVQHVDWNDGSGAFATDPITPPVLPPPTPPHAVPTYPLFTRPSLRRRDGRRRALSAFARCHVRRPRYHNNNNKNLYSRYIRTVFVYAPKGCTVLINTIRPLHTLAFISCCAKKYQVDDNVFQ